MKRDSLRQVLSMAAFGTIPVVWLALLAAPVISGGGLAGRLPEIMRGLTAALNNPLHIIWCEGSVKTVL